MLDHLHSMAASSLGEDLQEELPAIVSVPAGLTDAQYELYERVAESAGFYVVSTVAEPVAAVHAAEMWAIEESGSGKPLSSGGVVAVFDMGGYTSSISFVQKKPKKTGYVLLGSQSSTRISGRLIDDQLFRLAVDKFREQHGIDLSIDFMASYRILEAVEAAKKELSTRRSTDVNLPFITADATGAKHLVQTLTSFDIDRAYEQPTEEAVALCNRALKVAHLKKSDVSALLVVGGGARAEFLRKELEIFFTQAAFTAKDFRPEEAVVVGAAEFGRRLVESGEAL
jgi:molecular chaperone DnaK